MAGEGLQALAGRPGWAVGGGLAIFEPALGGWRAVVRLIVGPGRAFVHWLIAIVDPAGHAHLALAAVTMAEARRVAEGKVRAKAGY